MRRPRRCENSGRRRGRQALTATPRRRRCAPIPWPLPVGPDPEADADHQLQLVNGELVMPGNLRWLTEFGRAVDIGMGFRVNLTQQMAGGFDQLMVAGLRADPDAAHGKQLL